MRQAPLMVVVGASSETGEGVLRLASIHGYRTLGLDQTSSPAADEHRLVDIRNEASLSKAFSDVIEIDALVFAAKAVSTRPISSLTWQDWNDVIQGSVRGAMLTLKHAAPRLKDGTGSITLICAAAYPARNKGNIAERTANAALIGLMRATSGEFAERGIRVNAIVPDEGIMSGQNTPTLNQTTKNVAEAVHFLSSSDASFITGTEVRTSCS